MGGFVEQKRTASVCGDVVGAADSAEVCVGAEVDLDCLSGGSERAEEKRDDECSLHVDR